MTTSRPAMDRAASLSLIALILAGCGGGGGSGGNATIVPTVTASASTGFLAPNTTVAYLAASASVTTGTAVGVGSRIDPAGLAGTVSVATNSSGDISGLAFDLVAPPGGLPYRGNFTGTGDPVSSGSTSLANLVSMQKTIKEAANGTTGVILSEQAASQQLSFSTYGAWAVKDGTGSTGLVNGRLGVFAFGNLTPIASIPASGSATYNGTTKGVGSKGYEAYALIGSVQVIANFDTRSVTANITNLSTQNVADNSMGTLPNLTSTSSLVGTAYGGPLAGTGLAGTLYGNLYGATAQETAGVWKADGGGTTYMGGFGAK